MKTNLDALPQYHLHPETKFLNGDFTDSGKTQRRHIIVKSVQHIGKEANKWEEQVFWGLDPDAQIECGACPEQTSDALRYVLEAIGRHGAKRVAEVAKLTERHVFKIDKGAAAPSEKVLALLHTAAKALDEAGAAEEALRHRIRDLIEERGISIRRLAAILKVDPSNLSKMLAGNREIC